MQLPWAVKEMMSLMAVTTTIKSGVKTEMIISKAELVMTGSVVVMEKIRLMAVLVMMIYKEMQETIR